MQNQKNSPNIKIWLIDDDELVRSTTAQWLSLSDHEVIEFTNPLELLDKFNENENCVIISDIRMAPIDGLTLLAKLIEKDPHVPVILITGHGDIDMAVSSLRDGAFDFLEKPFDPKRLSVTVEKAIKKRQLWLDQHYQNRYLDELEGLEELIIGQCYPIKQVREQVNTFAKMDTNVIVYGDTGCGKELVAQALHQTSHRSGHPFVAINCAAIPAELFESELFGHEAGSFTGANKKRIGKIENASNGTLFLDEIESMPIAMQIKLLRVLQENILERVGSNQPIHVDLRVIAAAKTDLQRLDGFRQDLFFRLNVSQIHLPTLRQRGDDIPLLFKHFCRQFSDEKKVPLKKLSPIDHETLMIYSWPGNIREMRNIALRYVLEPNTTIAKILNGYHTQEPNYQYSPLPLSVKVQDYERSLIDSSLERCKGNIQEALEILQLPRRTLNQKMQKYGLNRSDYLDSQDG
ncbi:sigma-54 dependent transcriptional regulator [Marinomonas sp. 15G1-11]|uniref:Sigma-54 dependent transcriptional regulator n=1 Tax=Marinomonas phaeophyticola TaxID=3004091 RepID=A0ABT4JQ59_9GAMM|nr:sigma-54 dependent transcriptional regulator [Marinomonas sp. 15G1-11]MCZ2720522.1 sigma-54 dependent transcriptional regulator [Marinomonas sp. 15G1-11]